jgi:hypothetical protein
LCRFKVHDLFSGEKISNFEKLGFCQNASKKAKKNGEIAYTPMNTGLNGEKRKNGEKVYWFRQN